MLRVRDADPKEKTDYHPAKMLDKFRELKFGLLEREMRNKEEAFQS
jgi:hypothetical protein